MASKYCLLTILSAFVIISCNSNEKKNESDSKVNDTEVFYNVTLNNLVDKNDGVKWFNIKLFNKSNINHSTLSYKKDYEQYTISLDYYLNKAINDISLNYCNIEIAPIAYQFENNYNLVGYDMIVVGFDINEFAANCTSPDGIILFNDRNYNNKIQKFIVSINN